MLVLVGKNMYGVIMCCEQQKGEVNQRSWESLSAETVVFWVL